MQKKKRRIKKLIDSKHKKKVFKIICFNKKKINRIQKDFIDIKNFEKESLKFPLSKMSTNEKNVKEFLNNSYNIVCIIYEKLIFKYQKTFVSIKMNPKDILITLSNLHKLNFLKLNALIIYKLQ